jgi:ATP-dependent DNA helicase RecQ
MRVPPCGAGPPLVSDELVEAAAALVKDWLPGFNGTVVVVPGLDPTRGDVASRLAAA